MDDVARLVPKPPAQHDEGGYHDSDQYRSPNDGIGDSRVDRLEIRDLSPERDVIRQGVAGGDQSYMADDQMEAHLAVGPVPDSQPVETNERFKPPQPGRSSTWIKRR